MLRKQKAYIFFIFYFLLFSLLLKLRFSLKVQIISRQAFFLWLNASITQVTRTGWVILHGFFMRFFKSSAWLIYSFFGVIKIEIGKLVKKITFCWWISVTVVGDDGVHVFSNRRNVFLYQLGNSHRSRYHCHTPSQELWLHFLFLRKVSVFYACIHFFFRKPHMQ